MFPPFPQESARHYCQKLISLIESEKISLKQCGRESEERKGQGVMIGSLVCWDNAEKRRIVLYAVSGNNKKLESNIPLTSLFSEKSIFVPSIVSPQAIEQALLQNDQEIHELTDKINKLTLVNKSSPERKELIQTRTKLTDQSLKNVFSLYSFTSYDSKQISLSQIIESHGNKLPPTGTGDCCAPKLLNYAFQNHLEPVSMDEVYFGRNTTNKTNG